MRSRCLLAGDSLAAEAAPHLTRATVNLTVSMRRAADIKPAAAPAPGPTAAPQIDIIYIQQANNARMTPSPTDPNSGVLTLNGAIDTSLYVQVCPHCPYIEVATKLQPRLLHVVTSSGRACALRSCPVLV